MYTEQARSNWTSSPTYRPLLTLSLVHPGLLRCGASCCQGQVNAPLPTTRHRNTPVGATPFISALSASWTTQPSSRFYDIIIVAFSFPFFFCFSSLVAAYQKGGFNLCFVPLHFFGHFLETALASLPSAPRPAPAPASASLSFVVCFQATPTRLSSMLLVHDTPSLYLSAPNTAPPALFLPHPPFLARNHYDKCASSIRLYAKRVGKNISSMFSFVQHFTPLCLSALLGRL